MNARTGRPPDPDCWRRGSLHAAAASRACSGLAALTVASATLRARRPSLQQLFDMIERLESVARALQQLTLPEDATPPPPCTAASLAARVADAGRAVTSLTAGWRQHLPDPNAQQDALRLSNEICRRLVQLAAIERRKETTDHDQ